MVLVALAAVVSGCEDDVGVESPPEAEIPFPSSPEKVFEALIAIYNNESLPFEERLGAYSDLFASDEHGSLPQYTYRFPPDSVWTRDQELEAHRVLFELQSRGDHARVLDLQMDYSSAAEGTMNGHVEVLVEHIFLAMHFWPDDDILVLYNTSARFVLAPLNDRWYIVEWHDVGDLANWARFKQFWLYEFDQEAPHP